MVKFIFNSFDSMITRKSDEITMNDMAPKYPKIQSIFIRDPDTHKFIESHYSLPEFNYLKGLNWEWTEKIDGTNIRVIWDSKEMSLEFRGRTDKAQIPSHLEQKLERIFDVEKWKVFYETFTNKSVVLYGEGFGYKIQKGGKYLGDKVDFILFDVFIDNIWLQRKDMVDIAGKLGIQVVPIVAFGTLEEAVRQIKGKYFKSTFGNFLLEGFVLKPMVPLLRRNGDRIITKIKHVDFKE